jgi:hypothetical protein
MLYVSLFTKFIYLFRKLYLVSLIQVPSLSHYTDINMCTTTTSYSIYEETSDCTRQG